jgi:predicted nucleotidyltransferase component of viral defense system
VSKRVPTNVAASVRQRLLNLSKEKGEDFTLTLVRYVAERFLYRLSMSAHAEQFILKGALLLATRVNRPYRATRDIDFLGYGEASEEGLAKAIADIAGTEVEDDGLTFDLDTLKVEEIRENQDYGGLRVSVSVILERARIPLQIDVGYGDAVVPATIELEYPTLLGGATPRVRAYPIETVVAEKVEAIAKLGMANSRMKDYYDLQLIAATCAFDGRVLTRAFRATFERRGTELSANDPIGLTREFAEAPDNVKRWRAFIETNGLDDAPKDLRTVVDAIRDFVAPALRAAALGRSLEKGWSPSEVAWR